MSSDPPERAPVILAVGAAEPIERVQRALAQRSEWRTVLAYSAAEAFAVLQAVLVDVVVVEHHMPHVSGLELLERAAYVGQRPSSILSTDTPAEPAVLEAQARGVIQWVLEKPWPQEELLAAVGALLRDRPRRP